MAKVAVVETKANRNTYSDFSFEFDRYQLCSNPAITKVLKANVDIDIDVDNYDWVILIGSDALKYFTKETSITQYTGRAVEKKFLAAINPAMLSFNPGMRKTWDDTVSAIENFVSGKSTTLSNDFKDYAVPIQDTEEALEYVQKAIDYEDSDVIGLDSETSALYPRDGYVLGISLAYCHEHAAYIDSNCIDERVENKLQELFNKKTVVLQNAKFDLKFFEYHFNFKFPVFHDTMLMHYIINELEPHGLKYLAIRYTKFGDYEKELVTWKEDYCKTHKVKKSDFSYEKIPFDVMYPYAALDALVTYTLFFQFRDALSKNKKLKRVYNKLMIPACRLLVQVEQEGIPFNRDRLIKAEKLMDENISEAVEELYKFDEIKRFEEENKDSLKGGVFNPASVMQLRKLLFDYAKLSPTGIRTDKGEHSTNSEALSILAEEHPIPKLILDIRKKSKIKNTYLSKLIPELDKDDRVRTNFNQHMTTSGRLSSSGKFNAQQIPRDDPIVKGCIWVPEGRKIVAMDLANAEMYYAAALSEDPILCDIFRSGEKIHDAVAKEVFNLPCKISDVQKLYPTERQATKAINFGIIYGAGGYTISNSIKKDTGIFIPVETCNEYIQEYFFRFKKLKKWLENTKSQISRDSFIYSHFGRKRRLPDVKSDNKAKSMHEVRSGLNFVIQSLASDVNVLGCIEANEEIIARNLDAGIFMLVHDSVVANVADEYVDQYIEILDRCIKRDRGVSIPGFPIGTDFDIHEDYSLGKFADKYPQLA